MWAGHPAVGPLVAPDQVPDWLRTLTAATADLAPDAFDWLGTARDPRPAAVLIVFGNGPDGTGQDSDGQDSDGQGSNGPDVLLQLRADTLGAHAGQVSFPGGAAEPGDADPVATALREAGEEVGLRAESVRPVATLPPLTVPVSGYRVTPVLAHWTREQRVRAVDPAETAAVARVPVGHLAAPENRCSVRGRSGRALPAFLAPGMLVWGFTGFLVTLLLGLGDWESPWDTGDVRGLDEAWQAARDMPPLAGRVP